MFLAQAAPQTASSFMSIVSAFPFWMWIVFGGMIMGTIFGLTQMITNHRERIEQIRHGQVPPPQDD